MKSRIYESPCGELIVGTCGDGICICDWTIGNRAQDTLRRMSKYLPDLQCRWGESLLDRCLRQLDEYFAGRRKEMDIPMTLYGTEFQRRVWTALRKVPYGETASYSQVATWVGVARGVRAVAAAIGANPLSLLIPCHRIIGSNGDLTGYAGGLETKRYLLELEAE